METSCVSEVKDMTERVEMAVKLWEKLRTPKSFLEGRSMSDQLIRLHYAMTLDERATYHKRIWTLTQEGRCSK